MSRTTPLLFQTGSFSVCGFKSSWAAAASAHTLFKKKFVSDSVY